MGEARDIGFETLLLECKDDATVITVNRPSVLNALNEQVLREISLALDRIEKDGSLTALIFTGQGPKAFVGGADIAAMEKMSPEAASALSAFGQEVFLRIENLPIPTIAAVNGFALGGGNELALACDLRVAAANARFGQPEVGLGITPGFGGTQRLARLVGKSRALDLILTGRVINAEEAFRLGLADRLVSEGEALTESLALAKSLSMKSPFAQGQSKKAVLGGLALPVEDGLLLERRLFSQCFSAPDQALGMRAFLEKRPPAYRRDR
jgi:enoyl-CoA hydratase